MYKVYLQDSKQVHRLSRVVTLTRRQETILKAINPALLKAQNSCSVYFSPGIQVYTRGARIYKGTSAESRSELCRSIVTVVQPS